MTVFKSLLKIINKSKGMLILYTIILISVILLNQSSTDANGATFAASKPTFVIVNNDKMEGVTKGLINYIEKNAIISDIDGNDEDAVSDALFYRIISISITIPENFNEDFINNKNPIIDYKVSGTDYSSYASMFITNYLNIYSTYKDYYSGDELYNKVENVLDDSLDVEIKSGLDVSKLYKMKMYYNFLNYSLLAGCVYCISMVLASIKEKNVYKRTIVSSYDYKKFNRITLLSNLLLTIIMFLVYNAIGYILFGNILFSTNGLLFILNSFIFSICALSVGLLIGNLTQNRNAVGGIVNIVALGSSFLCGSFVPMEFMPTYVINIAHILPSYYFVSNNEYISSLEVFNFGTLSNYFINLAIILLFSFIFIVIIDFISKRKQKIN